MKLFKSLSFCGVYVAILSIFGAAIGWFSKSLSTGTGAAVGAGVGIVFLGILFLLGDE